MFWKVVRNQAALCIPEDFHRIDSNNRSSHPEQYNLPTPHVDAYKYSFYPRTIRVWNILPANVTQIADKDVYKDTIQNLFIAGQMYVVPPRGQTQRPRLGSTSCVERVGPVY